VSLWASADRPRDTLDPKRRQHASGKLLAWLLQAGPPGGKVLGLTDQDLFIPILTYVFGEAQLGGRAAVCSAARLAEGVEVAGPRLLRDRLAKEAIHEVGHAFGLHHCDLSGCVMGRSPGVAGVDAKSHQLCTTCRRQLVEPRTRRSHVR
jgi:archaemetzincin